MCRYSRKRRRVYMAWKMQAGEGGKARAQKSNENVSKAGRWQGGETGRQWYMAQVETRRAPREPNQERMRGRNRNEEQEMVPPNIISFFISIILSLPLPLATHAFPSPGEACSAVSRGR